MKIILITILLSVTLSLTIHGQSLDSAKVEQITYTPNSKDERMILVSKKQMDAKIDYDKGYSLVGNHEFRKALNPLKKAIEIDSTGNCGTGKNGMAYSELGYAYTRLGEVENAMVYLDEAIKINKSIPEPYLNKSVILTQKGNKELALKVLNSLIENCPDYAMAYVQRGFTYESTKEYELAISDFNKYLKLVKEQNQIQNSKMLVDDIKKIIKELKKKIKE